MLFKFTSVLHVGLQPIVRSSEWVVFCCFFPDSTYSRRKVVVQGSASIFPNCPYVSGDRDGSHSPKTQPSTEDATAWSLPTHSLCSKSFWLTSSCLQGTSEHKDFHMIHARIYCLLVCFFKKNQEEASAGHSDIPGRGSGSPNDTTPTCFQPLYSNRRTDRHICSLLMFGMLLSDTHLVG